MSNGGGPLLAIFARGGCEQRRTFSGDMFAERKKDGIIMPRPSFFEGWNSTVVARVGFLADSRSASSIEYTDDPITPRL